MFFACLRASSRVRARRPARPHTQARPVALHGRCVVCCFYMFTRGLLAGCDTHIVCGLSPGPRHGERTPHPRKTERRKCVVRVSQCRVVCVCACDIFTQHERHVIRAKTHHLCQNTTPTRPVHGGAPRESNRLRTRLRVLGSVFTAARRRCMQSPSPLTSPTVRSRPGGGQVEGVVLLVGVVLLLG